jgi:uncharacterized membrane protein
VKVRTPAEEAAADAAVASEQWWTELDDAVLACIRQPGGMSAAELGRRLGMSEAAASSVLGMLAREGRVRILRVEAA